MREDFDLLEFGRRYLWPMLELLLGWVLLVYGLLRLVGRVQAGERGRYPGGGMALVTGLLLLSHACGEF